MIHSQHPLDRVVRTKTWTNMAREGVRMPSCTKEQRERAPEDLGQCDGRVTQAVTRLGYPPGQTTCRWIGARRRRPCGPPGGPSPTATRTRGRALGAVDASRGHGHVARALRTGEDPTAVSEKVAGRIMREEGPGVCR